MTPDEKITELKAATRAANEALADLRAVQREIREQIAELDRRKAALPTEVDRLIGDAVKTGMASYAKALSTAIDEATEATFRRFDTLAAIVMGEEKDDKEPLPVLLRRWRETKPELGYGRRAGLTAQTGGDQ